MMQSGKVSSGKPPVMAQQPGVEDVVDTNLQLWSQHDPVLTFCPHLARLHLGHPMGACGER